MSREIVEAFHNLYYDARCWEQTRWMGVPCQKNPMDLWAFQEILWETRPDLILETGTAAGGSALYLADLGRMICGARVVTVDIQAAQRPAHPAVTYVTGDSSDPRTAETVLARIRELRAARTMVVLDSDHSRAHVLKELDLYAPLVAPGCYLVVEDTNVNGHPAFSAHGPGPWEALEEWLPRHPEFEVDRSREKHLMTLYPGGFLRRKA